MALVPGAPTCYATALDAVTRMKSSKHDGYLGLSSDHVKHACLTFYIHLSMMFTALIVHGCITDDLSSSKVLPIPKGKNLNHSDSINYRGIALSSILGKISDSYVLNRYLIACLLHRIYNLISRLAILHLGVQ